MVRVIAIAGIVLMHVLANGNYDLSGFLFEKVIGTAGNFTILFMMVSAFECVADIMRNSKQKQLI